MRDDNATSRTADAGEFYAVVALQVVFSALPFVGHVIQTGRVDDIPWYWYVILAAQVTVLGCTLAGKPALLRVCEVICYIGLAASISLVGAGLYGVVAMSTEMVPMAMAGAAGTLVAGLFLAGIRLRRRLKRGR